MFDNFAFETRDKAVVGYHFPCENASHVMCLIHGIGEHAGRYRRMADMLCEKGIAVVAMDLRGHGISGGVRGDTAPREEVLKDVDELIKYAQRFYPGLPVTLYGHSMGGNICLDYRARGTLNDVPAKYIVSAPWIKLVQAIPKPVYKALKLAVKVAPKFAISQSFPEDFLGNPEKVRPYNDDPLVHSHITLRCAEQGFDIGNAIYDGTNEDNHKADNIPFLLMHGDADRICDVDGSRALAERMAANPNFTYIEWPEYYHEIHNGGADITGDEVIQKIGEFITN